MNNDFDTENKACWKAALEAAFPTGVPQSASWTNLNAIITILNLFCGQDLSHAMLPFGGGAEVQQVIGSKEAGCIELQSSPDIAYVCRPLTLHFEHLSDSPWNSFLMLSTQELQPSGVYSELPYLHEELLELPDGKYFDCGVLDDGNLGFDESGNEIPIRDPYRVIFRCFTGKFLIVAKRSIWNQTPETYDGLHADMTPAEIREEIESALR